MVKVEMYQTKAIKIRSTKEIRNVYISHCPIKMFKEKLQPQAGKPK